MSELIVGIGGHWLQFTKMHGAGNDYVFIDARQLHTDWSALAIAISDRHVGVGSDGLILLLPSDESDIRMRMFNADGSEGEMCGNGIRCLVGFAIQVRMISSTTSPVTVETLDGVKYVTPILESGVMVGASVQMGEPRFSPEEIPVVVQGLDEVTGYTLTVNSEEFAITCVSMGNPHAVAFIEKPVDEVALHEVGPIVEHHQMFPQRTNFEIVNVLDSNHLKVRVWERGSGLTMACGTGACAVAVAAHKQGYIDGRVNIELPGGTLTVNSRGERGVVLEGPIATSFIGEWVWPGDI